MEALQTKRDILQISKAEVHNSLDITWQDVQNAVDAALNNAGFWYILWKKKGKRGYKTNQIPFK